MKKISIIFAALFFSASVFSQQAHFKGFEFYGNAAVGMFDLDYSPTSGSQFGGPGMRAGLGFGYFPISCLGISTGIDFSVYSAFSNIKAGSNFSYKAYDSDGLYYIHKLNIDNKFNEQNVMYRVELPLMLQYRHYFSSGNGLFASGGIKISLPMASYYHVSSGTATATGRYYDLNVTMSDIPWLGFTTYDYKGTSGMIPSKSTYLASFEIGYLRKLRKTTYATFSIFADYSMSNIRRSLTQRSLIFPTGQYAGILNSNFIDKANLISVGVKAAWHINLSGEPLAKGQKRSYEQPKKSAEPLPDRPTRPAGGHQRTR